jgi:hypothetical protein
LIAKVTSNPSYRNKARWFQNVLREKPGLDLAADIIERVFEVPKEVPARQHQIYLFEQEFFGGIANPYLCTVIVSSRHG